MIKPTKTNNEKNSKRKYWTQAEDTILRNTVKIHGSNWKIIAEYLNDRNASQCAQRWKRIKPNTEKNRQKWDLEEDNKLKQLIKEYHCDWKIIARFLPHRTSRQILERFINHLDPQILHREWTTREDQKIWNLYNRIGSSWSEIAKKLKGRPENMIKNRFYGYIRKTYGNQPNPYYVIPEQKRSLLIEGGDRSNDKQIQEIDNLKIKEREILIKQVDNQEQCLEYFDSEVLSSNHAIDSDRHILIKTQEHFSKQMYQSTETQLQRDELFQNFLCFESNMRYYNQNQDNLQFKQKLENNEFFQNQFSCPYTSTKLKSVVFEELTKQTPVQESNC